VHAHSVRYSLTAGGMTSLTVCLDERISGVVAGEAGSGSSKATSWEEAQRLSCSGCSRWGRTSPPNVGEAAAAWSRSFARVAVTVGSSGRQIALCSLQR
jgi:hypothetical protein